MIAHMKTHAESVREGGRALTWKNSLWPIARPLPELFFPLREAAPSLAAPPPAAATPSVIFSWATVPLPRPSWSIFTCAC
jgi:hypothetical protein